MNSPKNTKIPNELTLSCSDEEWARVKLKDNVPIGKANSHQEVLHVVMWFLRSIENTWGRGTGRGDSRSKKTDLTVKMFEYLEINYDFVVAHPRFQLMVQKKLEESQFDGNLPFERFEWMKDPTDIRYLGIEKIEKCKYAGVKRRAHGELGLRKMKRVVYGK